MAYPYISSGGLVQQAFQQFRKSFPAKVEADTLKKLGIASSNESYVIAIFKFLGIIADDNTRTDFGTKLFTSHKDEDFQTRLSEGIEKAYSALFELHGPASWNLDKDSLITFFRERTARVRLSERGRRTPLQLYLHWRENVMSR